MLFSYFPVFVAFFLSNQQCKEKSTTMQPMVGGKLSKSEESYPNACETRAPESVQFKEKKGKFKRKIRKSNESKEK